LDLRQKGERRLDAPSVDRVWLVRRPDLALVGIVRRGHARQGREFIDRVVRYRNARLFHVARKREVPGRRGGPRARVFVAISDLALLVIARCVVPLSRALTYVAADKRFIELWRLRRHSYLVRLQQN
jgi:hypothetical protein